jgi:hypothetical protein
MRGVHNLYVIRLQGRLVWLPSIIHVSFFQASCEFLQDYSIMSFTQTCLHLHVSVAIGPIIFRTMGSVLTVRLYFGNSRDLVSRLIHHSAD